MNAITPAPFTLADEPGPDNNDPENIRQAALAAAGRIAPLWPLRNFVAVNPFLGMTDQSFESAAQVMSRVAGAHMTMSASYYLEALASGRMDEADIDEALARTPGWKDRWGNAAAFLGALGDADPVVSRQPVTVTDVVDSLHGTRWSDHVVERISAWAAQYFDEGQALWPCTPEAAGAYPDWLVYARHDRTPEVAGLKGVRKIFSGLGADAGETLVATAAGLGLPRSGLETYFHALLMSVGGWAAYARYKGWDKEQRLEVDTTLRELLVIRLAWDAAVHHCLAGEPDFEAAWARARLALLDTEADAALEPEMVLQTAFEIAHQRQLADRLAGEARAAGEARKSVQAAFCIDVRSEPIRRALEAQSDAIETMGFVGFFGIPMEYVSLGRDTGDAQCPVLIQPKFSIRETLQGAATDIVGHVARRRAVRHKVAKAWKNFQSSAISSFSFVDVMGLSYIGKLATDGLGISRTVPHPRDNGLDAHHSQRLAPDIEPCRLDGKAYGLSPSERLELAQGILTSMSLTDRFARLVLFVGHASSSVNNPHSAGLDCGACGGHAGDANARVACAILNDLEVRAGLKAKGIDLPADTVFVAARHNTTTDEVTLYDRELVPTTHRAELDQFEGWLRAATARARSTRAPSLRIDARPELETAWAARGKDWSQVRPEWGLAGCSSFIAAPRSRTSGIDLKGRSFLHDYDWTADPEFRTLESIMSAPLVVASWIGLQYYASTVDNQVFGSGNKTLHNVVGTLGVLEGNGGDLRAGLPLQSVHDGSQFIHEPLRLSAFFEAPIEGINHVIARQPAVSRLVDNSWVHLFAIDPEGAVWRYTGDLEWVPCQPSAAHRDKPEGLAA